MSSISNGMKKLLTLVFLIVSMTGVAHAASCPQGQFPDSAGVCWSTQAAADAATASYTAANELTPAQQAAQPSALTSAQAQAAAQQTQQTPGGTGFVALAPIPGLTSQDATSVLNATSFAAFFNNLYKYLIGLAATLAVIQIIWAGLDIAIWHKDAVSAITDDKGKIYNAIFGLVLVLSPVLVFSIINPNILNLSLSVKPLDTKTITMPGVDVGTPSSTVDTATGCVVTGGDYLKTAVCTSNGTTDALSLVNTWGNNNCTLLVDDTASPTCIAGNNPCTKATASCEKKSSESYTFINIGTASFPNLQPFDAQTSAAMSGFVSGCHGDGGVACINRTYSAIPILGGGTSCPTYTSALPQGASGDCYNMSLYCFTQADASIANGIAVSKFTNMSHNYACEPVLKFTAQPLQ